MHIELIEEFKDTRKISQGKFKKETNELLKTTYLFKEPLTLPLDTIRKKNTNVLVIESDTVTTIINNSIDNGIKVAALNFADAIEPGGLVLQGARTQEEQICRCSNLYESLLTQKKEYYEYNKQFQSAIFTDRTIYSKGVTIFKDNNFNSIEPIKTDIITCPSPACKVGDVILCARILGILKISAVMNVDLLILGAWGCGAFHQDAQQMAKCFKYVISRYNIVEKIVFAIPDSNSYNYKEFYNAFN